MGIFSGIDKAVISERGKWIVPNFVGALRIRRTVVKDSIKHGLAFIVEFDVIGSNLLEDHPIKSSVTWFQKMSDKTVAFPSIKAFVAAASGIFPGDRLAMDEINREIENILEEACVNETSNALVGQEVRVETFATTTQKGHPFTRHNWLPA